MSCPNTDQTLLWLYGESDDPDAALHVSTCASCTEVVATHEAVQGVVAPLAPQLSVRPAPANTQRWWPVVAMVAAATLLVVGLSLSDPAGLQADDTDLVALIDEGDLDLPEDGRPLFDDLDAGIQALEFEVADMYDDFGSL